MLRQGPRLAARLARHSLAAPLSAEVRISGRDLLLRRNNVGRHLLRGQTARASRETRLSEAVLTAIPWPPRPTPVARAKAFGASANASGISPSSAFSGYYVNPLAAGAPVVSNLSGFYVPIFSSSNQGGSSPESGAATPARSSGALPPLEETDLRPARAAAQIRARPAMLGVPLTRLHRTVP